MSFLNIIDDTAANWTAKNPVLDNTVIGREFQLSNFVQVGSLACKIGDGVTHWNDLPYLSPSGVKVYRAKLTQSGTADPGATVLENTLGGVVTWTRTSTGIYKGTLVGAFPVAQTYIDCPKAFPSGDDLASLQIVDAQVDETGTDAIRLATGGLDGEATGTLLDDILFNFPLTVFVSPS